MTDGITPRELNSKNPRVQARIQAGLTRKKAARIAGVKPSTFARWESSGGVPYPRAVTLAALFRCRVEIFM